ncbi:asparaginase [Halegenticoccus tardaugens]|uniref:asparaginase n=1 Tax=Halegenticoccus tardaugens TaxID=2071624 RepID=UPI00100B8375|nr:asparaginase [Halegenticoccus tardaugens]
MPTVRVLSCGGTIASEPDDAGAAPAKSGRELVDAVPALSAHADLRVEEIASRPGFDMDVETVARVAEAAATAADADADDRPDGTGGADGIVITQGTDTIAEVAYALDLAPAIPVPIVVTGAQRRFDEPGSDAPANLLAAVRAATDERFAAGVYVAFDDELHAARDAVKAHTNALGAFESPGKGPVATFTRGGVRVHREPRSYSDDVPAIGSGVTVPVVHSGLGVDGGRLEREVDAGADGVIVEGTGLGNVTGDLGDAIAAAAERVPVVVASRCHAGPTEPVYGTRGGGVTLRDHGALFADDLPAAKARVKLLLALSAGLSDDEIAALFDD